MLETRQEQTNTIDEIQLLLAYYSFELKEHNYEIIMKNWLEKYSPQWIRLAVLEALYLGRYKIVSIEQILSSWQKRGNYTLRFNHDFETLICRNLPHKSTPENSLLKSSTSKTAESIREFKPNLPISKFFFKLKAISQYTISNY